MPILTDDEFKIAKLITKGLHNEDIAKRLGKTTHVIKSKVRSIYDKLGLHNRVEVALWFIYNYERKV